LLSKEVLDILPEEVRHTIKSMKNGNAAEIDGITAEIFKTTGNFMDVFLAKIFTSCLRKNNIPQSWKYDPSAQKRKQTRLEQLPSNQSPPNYLQTFHNDSNNAHL
jgi:hypothetical protein